MGMACRPLGISSHFSCHAVNITASNGRVAVFSSYWLVPLVLSGMMIVAAVIVLRAWDQFDAVWHCPLSGSVISQLGG